MALTLWAKSPPKTETRESLNLDCTETLTGYPLLPHLLDVAAVAAKLQKIIPPPVDSHCSEEWISSLVGLHDLGKATPGFQKKLGLDFCAAAAPDRHDASTIPLLKRQLEKIGVTKQVARQLAMAVGAHHGSLITSIDIHAASRWQFEPDWLATHEELFENLLVCIEAQGIPELPSDGLDDWFGRQLNGWTSHPVLT